MKLLNASHRTISVMMDRGDIITVKPGQFSGVFVASKNTILACIKSGKPSEIGIILGGTYEQGIASSITGGQPYYYLSEDEAKAKLIDPTIDYGKSMQSSQTDSMRQEIVDLTDKTNNLESQIQTKNSLIEKLESDLERLKSDGTASLRIKTLEDEIASVKASNKTLTSELEGAKSDITTHLSTIQTLTADKTALKDRVDSLVEIKKSLEDDVDKVKTQSANRQTQIDELSTKNRELEDQNSKLKTALDEASQKIDTMRSTFNSVCDQFGIYYGDDGSWHMENKQVSDNAE